MCATSAKVDRCWPCLAGSGQTLTDLGRLVSNIGQTRPTAKFVPEGCGTHQPRLCQIPPELEKYVADGNPPSPLPLPHKNCRSEYFSFTFQVCCSPDMQRLPCWRNCGTGPEIKFARGGFQQPPCRHINGFERIPKRLAEHPPHPPPTPPPRGLEIRISGYLRIFATAGAPAALCMQEYDSCTIPACTTSLVAWPNHTPLWSGQSGHTLPDTPAQV